MNELLELLRVVVANAEFIWSSKNPAIDLGASNGLFIDWLKAPIKSKDPDDWNDLIALLRKRSLEQSVVEAEWLRKEAYAEVSRRENAGRLVGFGRAK